MWFFVLNITGAEVDAATPIGWSPIIYAASRGHSEVMSALIAAGKHAHRCKFIISVINALVFSLNIRAVCGVLYFIVELRREPESMVHRNSTLSCLSIRCSLRFLYSVMKVLMWMPRRESLDGQH